eukprot:c17953_g1_i1.p1 GENE.c17953_g1_i1~~c17953_g1_i1.p1  ORF type:complete len:321 (+),score=50.02 c17953_g1_i1:65-1027(+)
METIFGPSPSTKTSEPQARELINLNGPFESAPTLAPAKFVSQPIYPDSTRHPDLLQFQENEKPGRQPISGQMDSAFQNVPLVSQTEPARPKIITPSQSGAGLGSGLGAGLRAGLGGGKGGLASYRPYFDVTTKEVKYRLTSSIYTRFRWDDIVADKPDLYGPFWIATTLVFVLSVMGNAANALSFEPTPAQPKFTYDYSKVSLATMLVYGYVFGLPAVFWAVMKWFEAKVQITCLWCNFGYAMFVFIPCAGLCVIPKEIVRWALILVASVISANCAGRNTWYLIRTRLNSAHRITKATPICLGLTAAHVLFALCIKLYFF